MVNGNIRKIIAIHQVRRLGGEVIELLSCWVIKPASTKARLFHLEDQALRTTFTNSLLY
jgi:hypothetical protein